MQFKAKLYRTNSSSYDEVDVTLYKDNLALVGDTFNLNLKYSEVEIETPMKNCPFIINLSNGRRLESVDHNLNINVLKNFTSNNSKLLIWLETHKLGVLISTVLAVLMLFLSVKIIIPKFGKQIALYIPQDIAVKLDEKIMSSLDGNYLSESQLPFERQEELKNLLKGYYPNNDIKIYFRNMNDLPNAFALAGETVIITDKLVEIVNDKELLAIFLHEVGHLKNRHLLGQITSVAFLNILTFIVIGDMTGLQESLANITYSLSSLSFSRSFEHEADLYSAQKLSKLDISIGCFESGLGKLVDFYQKKFNQDKESSIFEDYLSTHPGFDERVQELKREFHQNYKNCE